MNGVNSEKSDLSKSPKVQAKGNINVNNHNNNNMMKQPPQIQIDRSSSREVGRYYSQMNQGSGTGRGKNDFNQGKNVMMSPAQVEESKQKGANLDMEQ